MNRIREMNLIELEGDSGDELPVGWEERVTSEGRVYYANHYNMSTQWQHPITNKEKVVSGGIYFKLIFYGIINGFGLLTSILELPHGWKKLVVDNKIIFINHLKKKTSYTDPRLAFAKPLTSKNLQSQKYLPETSALDVLKNRDLTGKYAIVTGGNRGLGLEIVRALAFTGCYVILACKDIDSGLLSYEKLKQERVDIKLEIMEINLASLQSVKNFAEKINSRNISLNMLFLNAAVFENDYKCSQDNIELMFQVNYLAHFYLCRLLTENLRNSIESRIIIIGCESHRGANLSTTDIHLNKLNVSKNEFHTLQQYCNSKMCLVLFAYEFNRRLNSKNIENVICKSCHPGNFLPTKLFEKFSYFWCFKNIFGCFSKKLETAAATPVFLAIENKENLNKLCHYWTNFNENMKSKEIHNSVLAYRLWEISECVLIDSTSSFDTFLADGDDFSSFTKIINLSED